VTAISYPRLEGLWIDIRSAWRHAERRKIGCTKHFEQTKEAEMGQISIQKTRSRGYLDKKWAAARSQQHCCFDQVVKERKGENGRRL
jgi:hypothetical protein